MLSASSTHLRRVHPRRRHHGTLCTEQDPEGQRPRGLRDSADCHRFAAQSGVTSTDCRTPSLSFLSVKCVRGPGRSFSAAGTATRAPGGSRDTLLQRMRDGCQDRTKIRRWDLRSTPLSPLGPRKGARPTAQSPTVGRRPARHRRMMYALLGPEVPPSRPGLKEMPLAWAVIGPALAQTRGAQPSG